MYDEDFSEITRLWLLLKRPIPWDPGPPWLRRFWEREDLTIAQQTSLLQLEKGFADERRKILNNANQELNELEMSKMIEAQKILG